MPKANGSAWRYWVHVGSLAWKEMRRELTKSTIRIVGVGVVAFLLYIYAGLLGQEIIDKVYAAGIVIFVGAVALFFWKLVTIPPKLYEWQQSRREHREAADAMRQLVNEARSLLTDPEGGGGDWHNCTLDWEEQVEKLLESYDTGELAMFESITEERPERASPESDSVPWPYSYDRMRAKLSKLRLIMGRAYARAGSTAAERYDIDVKT